MKKNKRAITLIEIIIVITLISIIGSALAINMRGSLDKGRAFKTEQNAEKIKSILTLAMEDEGRTLAEVIADWENYVRASPFVKGDVVLKDGWSNKFEVALSGEDIVVTSKRYDEYKKKHEVAKKVPSPANP